MTIATQKLGDLIAIKHGYAFESRYFTADGPYVLLTPGNFEDAGGFKRKPDQKHYDGPVLDEFVLKEGDLLVAMTEQSEGLLGSAAFVPSGKPCLHNQRLGLVQARCNKLDLRFIYYALNSRLVRQQIRASATGAKIRHTAPSRICDVDIPKLSGTQQNDVATVLGAYDALIGVNRRRIALLEEMAHALFEEWFVRFRFPGHEEVEIVDTGEGPLPRGWTRRTMGESYKIVLGGTPSRNRAELWGGDIPWIGSSKANDLRVVTPTEFITPTGYEKSATKLMPKGAVIVAITGATLGQVSVLTAPMCGNQSLVGVWDSTNRRNEFLYRYVAANIGRIIQAASGGAQQHINKEIVARYPSLEPPAKLLDEYARIAEPIADLLTTLLIQDERLSAQRDLLLPRFINGDVSIAAAERAAEGAATAELEAAE